MSNVYLLVHDPDPTQLTFLFDWDSSDDPDDVADPGERYDASDVPMLIAGFHGVVVEDELFVDEWGPSLSAYAPIRAPDGSPMALVGVDVAAEQFQALRQQVIGMTVGVWLFAIVLIGLASNRRGTQRARSPHPGDRCHRARNRPRILRNAPGDGSNPTSSA